MPKCNACGGHTEKVRRVGIERVIFRSAYRCQRCKRRFRYVNAWWLSTWRFIFSRYSVCVKCGTRHVHHLYKRDPILDLSKNPLSLIQVLFFARRKQCPYCRLQYYDLRAIEPVKVAHTQENQGAQL